jgi:hypothetical protein
MPNQLPPRALSKPRVTMHQLIAFEPAEDDLYVCDRSCKEAAPTDFSNLKPRLLISCIFILSCEKNSCLLPRLILIIC